MLISFCMGTPHTISCGRSCFRGFLVARGLRLLQSFTAFCRFILLNLFGISTRRATHNP